MVKGRAAGWSGVALVVLLGSACGQDEEARQPAMDERQTITVTSTAFGEGDRIPKRYTCDGENLSPPLAWESLPEAAVAVALVVDDPDAPRGTFTHWVVLDVPKKVATAAEGTVPVDGMQIENSAGQASYFGPCPPGGTHRYRFTIYALSAATELDESASLDEALRAVERSVVAWGRLTGVYSRS